MFEKELAKIALDLGMDLYFDNGVGHHVLVPKGQRLGKVIADCKTEKELVVVLAGMSKMTWNHFDLPSFAPHLRVAHFKVLMHILECL